MDANIINPFIEATLNVIETMAFMKAEAGKPFIKKDDTAHGAVTGVIGITGDANGTISVTFDEGCILKIVSSMFSEEVSELDSEVADAAGELTNMISGRARQKLEKAGKLFEAAIPSVITGTNHKIMHYTRGTKIAIPFTLEQNKFTIEVCLSN